MWQSVLCHTECANHSDLFLRKYQVILVQRFTAQNSTKGQKNRLAGFFFFLIIYFQFPQCTIPSGITKAQ